VTKRNRQSVRPQSSVENPASVLTIDQAFQRLLTYFGELHAARHRLHEALRAGEVQLWGSKGGKSFPVGPSWYEIHLLVVAYEGPKGWHATLEMRAAVQDFDKTAWAVRAKEIESLCEEESLPGAKRGRKGKYDWELFKTRFYILLDDDDLPANGNINQERYANELLVWGQNHPMVGEKKTPAMSTMREKVAEWAPLWRVLGAYKERPK
jgi:hypothetical protein